MENRSLVSISRFLSRPIDPSPLIRWLRERVETYPTATLFWLGALLRVWVYLGNRPYWMDESSLRANLSGGPILDFTRPLSADQLAPFGFLIAERLIVALCGDSTYATRLIPLICGIAALWLFRDLAERSLSRSGAIVAMILFAFSDDLIYYASELKPYSSDLAVGLAVTLVGFKELHEGGCNRRLILLALLVVVSPWASFSSVFVVAGCGATLLVARLLDHRWRDAAWLAGIAAAWASSAFLAIRASGRMLHEATSMYVFWNFAFLPFPPTDRGSMAKAVGILLETFVTPLNLTPPFLPYLFAGLALAFLMSGMLSLGRRDTTALLILVVPLVLALAASALRKYPFHGRLILWLVPAFILLIAEGSQAIRKKAGRPLYVAALTILLLYPCLNALYQSAGPHSRDFNPHGDLRKNQFME